MSKFWIYDPTVILDKNKYWQIIPTREMELKDKLNTITRFLIYLIILLILFKRDSILLLLAFVAIVIIIIYYSLYTNDVNSVKLDINENFVDELNEYTPPKNIITSPIDAIDKKSGGKSGGGVSGVSGGKSGSGGGGIGTNNIYYGTNKSDNISSVGSDVGDDVGDGGDGSGGGGDADVNNNKGNIDLQTAYIDSNGDYVFGDIKKDSNIYSDWTNDKGSDGGITYKMNDELVNSTCRKPTADNPYANIVFSDYLDAGNVASPCNVDDDELPKKSLELYNSTIFRNVDDVFERENSQRLFYTLPINTVPNKQTEFARWLYDTGPRCKEDTSKCTYYEDPSMTSPRYL
jgi:hypothetical protein